MNFKCLSSRSISESRAEPRPLSALSKRSFARASLLALGIVACGDSAEPGYTTPDAGQPVYSTGGGTGATGGLTGVGGPAAPGLAPGQVYDLDAGSTVGQFGGTNGNGVFGVNPGGAGVGLTGGAGLTGGGFGVNPGGAGGATLGGIGGLLGGLGGGGAAAGIGGLGGFTGGGAAAMPVMPLDPSVKQPDASRLPTVKGTCPDIRSGNVSVNGSTAQLTVGSKPGPVLFYWHGTGGSAGEVEQGVPGATGAVRSGGGMVASFNDTNGKGDTTGNLVWYTGDLESADLLLACAIQKGNIVDAGRIHTAGYSAGGLQSGTMLLQRSGYIASAIVYSGGPPLGGLAPGTTSFSDPSHIPAVLGAHGAMGSDWLALDFYEGTNLIEDTVKKAGGFAIDCDDGGDHALAWVATRAGVGGQAWKFFQDHPYNTKPSPYAGGLPSGYPRYCKIK